jgi:hypothetical protein
VPWGFRCRRLAVTHRILVKRLRARRGPESVPSIIGRQRKGTVEDVRLFLAGEQTGFLTSGDGAPGTEQPGSEMKVVGKACKNLFLSLAVFAMLAGYIASTNLPKRGICAAAFT